MQKRKHLITAILMIAVIVSASIPVSGETMSSVKVMVNNRYISSSDLPVNIDGTVYVPAKEFIQAFGGTFSVDASSTSGVVSLGDNELVFYLDESAARFNGKYVKASAPMKITGYRFMIPAVFTCQALGLESYMSTKRNTLMVFQPSEGKLEYQVMSGDSLWIISQLFGVPISTIKQLNGLTGDMIYVGQKLIIKDDYNPSITAIPAYTSNSATIWAGPGFNYSEVSYLKAWTTISVAGKIGEWYKVETPKGNGYIYYTVISVKQDMSYIPGKSQFFSSYIPVDTTMDYVTYDTYTVQKDDYIWAISQKFGIPDYELAQANNITANTTLYPGQTLKIPLHIIPEKETPDPEYGEILDWYKEGQYVFPIGKVGKLIDMETGKSFMVKRTIGANHSDTETLTAEDSKVMKEVFGGSWTWNRRPFILEVDERRFAVSAAGMPHAGVDGVPFLQNVSSRSDNWGYGPNYDSISGNGMDGHFDLYFLNSLTHNNNSIDAKHQYNVMMAGGLH